MVKKTWLRPTQISRKFPQNKYHFTAYLKRPGDYLITNPITKADTAKITLAARTWAANRMWTIETQVTYCGENSEGVSVYTARIDLITLSRVRDFG
jgi:hypothetical protein